MNKVLPIAVLILSGCSTLSASEFEQTGVAWDWLREQGQPPVKGTVYIGFNNMVGRTPTVDKQQTLLLALIKKEMRKIGYDSNTEYTDQKRQMAFQFMTTNGGDIGAVYWTTINKYGVVNQMGHYSWSAEPYDAEYMAKYIVKNASKFW